MKKAIQILNPVQKLGAQRLAEMKRNQAANRQQLYDQTNRYTGGNVNFTPEDQTTLFVPKEYQFSEDDNSNSKGFNIIPESIKDDWNHSSIKDAYRMFLTQWNMFRNQSATGEILHDHDDLNDIELQQGYIKQMNKVAQAQKLYDQMPNVINKMQLDQATKDLDSYEKVIKENWSKSDNLINNFVNYNAKQDNISDQIFVNLANQLSRGSTEGYVDDKNKSWVANKINSAMTTLQNMATGTLESLAHPFIHGVQGGLSDREEIKYGIKQHGDQDGYKHLYDKYFTSWRSVGDLNKRAEQLQDALDIQKSQIERKLNEHISQEQHTRDLYLNGNWAFDPKKVDPVFRKKVENDDSSLLLRFAPWHILYSVPGLASSYSDIEDLGAQMANQGAFALAAKGLSFALGGGKFKYGASVLKYLLNAGKIANVGTGLYIANRLRENESGLETINAYSSRVLDDLQNSNVNIKNVIKDIEAKAIANGDNLDGYNDLEKIQYGLAYGIKTNSSEFNAAATNARNGLAKVWNDNQTLSTLDYLQTLPIMGHTGNFFKKALTRRALGKAAAGISDDVISATIKAGEKAAQSASDRIIDKLFKSGAEDVLNKVRAKQTVDFLKNKIATIGKIGASEGMEEGIQQILQNQYQRGEYDNYSQPTSVFQLPSIFNNLRMSAESVADYLGINFGNPDNATSDIRQAMNAGIVQGVLAFGLGGAMTNVLNRDQAENLGINSDNTRNLISALKNDNIIKSLVGEHYGKAEDNNHIGIFFDAYSKAGNNARRVSESLEAMKSFKGDLVDDDFIDKDIKLANETWNLYNSKVVDTKLKDLNISRDSEDHKKIIQNGVRFIQDYKNISNLHKDNLNETYKTIEQLRHDIVNDEGSMSDTNKSIYDAMLKDYNQYKENMSNAENDLYNSKEVKAEAEKQFLEQYNNDDYAEQAEAIKDQIAKNIAKERIGEIKSKEEYIGSRIDAIIGNIKQQAQEELINKLQNQSSLLKLLRNETGTDINVDKLQSIIKIIKRQNKKDKVDNEKSLKQINDAIDRRNTEIEKFNKVLPNDKKLEKIDRVTLQNFAERYNQFEDKDKLSELFQINAMNEAVLSIMSPNVTAYTIGESDPTDALIYSKGLTYNQLTDEQKAEFKQNIIKELQDRGEENTDVNEQYLKHEYTVRRSKENAALTKITKEYNKYKADLSKLDESSKPADREIIKSKLQELREKAAKELMSQHLLEKNERMKIAHLEFLKDGGITDDDINNLDTPNEDPYVRQAVDELAANEQNTENNVQQQTQPQQQDENVGLQENTESVDKNTVNTNKNSNIKNSKTVKTKEETDEVKSKVDVAKEHLKKQLYGENDVVSADEELPTVKFDGILSQNEPIKKILNSYKTIDDILNIKNGTPIARVVVRGERKYLVVAHAVEDGVHTVQLQYSPVLYGDNTKVNTVDNVAEELSVGFEIPDGFIDPSGQLKHILYMQYNEDVKTEAKCSQIHPHSDNDVHTIVQNAVISSSNDHIIDNTVEQPVSDTELQESEESESQPDSNSNDNTNELGENEEQQIPEDQNYNIDQIDEIDTDSEDDSHNANTDEENNNVTDESESLQEENKNDSPEVVQEQLKDDQIQSNYDNQSQYLNQTFFYQPNSTTPMVMAVDGKQLQFKYPIRPNAELSENLSKTGWFGSLDKFYIVTGSNDHSDPTNEPTVSLVMYDHENKATYVTTMRTPGTSYWYDLEGNEHKSNDYDKIVKSLFFIGVNKELYKKYFNKILLSEYSRATGKSISFDSVTNEPSSKSINDALKWYNGKDIAPDTVEYIRNTAKKYSTRFGAKTFTFDQIEQQIENLKLARHAIIDAYCDKNPDGTYTIPSTIKEHVRPQNTSISNGRITSQHTKHTLAGEEMGFGIPSDIKEINKKINDGELIFGYGSGFRGGDPMSITSLTPVKFDPHIGTGYSGNIYIIHRAENGNLVPIMLDEERFDKSGNSNEKLNRFDDNLIDVIDPETGNIVGQNIPSSAELLLYLVTGKLNTKYLPVGDRELIYKFASFFVNNGEHTIYQPEDENVKISFLEDKIFAVIDTKAGRTLQMTVKDENGNRIQKYYPLSQLFQNTDFSRNQRREVIYNIAENMHWNTDKWTLPRRINGDLIQSIKHYFEENPNAEQFSICGNKQLSINKHDLFDEKDGRLIYNSTTQLAWMLKTGRLLTTTIPGKIFEAPYVYATGIDVSESHQTLEQIKPEVIRTEKDKATDTVSLIPTVNKRAKRNLAERFDKVKVQHLLNLYKYGTHTLDYWFADTPERLNDFFNQYDEVFKSRNGVSDWVLFDIDVKGILSKLNTNASNDEKIQNYIKEYRSALMTSIQKYLDYYNKENNANIKISNFSIREDQISSMIALIASGKAIPELILYGNNTGVINIRSTESILNSTVSISGVFQKNRTGGKIDINKSREWLSNKLGIDKSQVVLLDSVMRSMDDVEVFGVTNVVTDILNHGDSPVLMFSSNAGSGTTYHEAWHYVNLLVHNKHYRQNIYDAYVKEHPQLKNKTYKEIEELLAEDFRKYCQFYNDDSIFGKIKIAFDRIIKFLGLYKNKYVMYSIFKDINSGKYKNVHLDSESIKEFKQKYSTGATMKNWSVGGINDEDLDKLKYINSYQDFFACATAIANKMIDDFAIDRIGNIQKVTDVTRFSAFIEKIYDEFTGINPIATLYLNDIKNNPELFSKIIRNIIKQYSVDVNEEFFNVNNKSQKDKSSNQREQDTNGIAENTYDVDPFSISKKDNVALRAKLFLGQIKMSHYDIDPITGEKIIIIDTDRIFGAPLYTPFSEAWNQILTNLWDTDSYGKRGEDGEYLPTSIRGAVKRLAKSNKFFYQLDKKLDLIEDDIQLQNQIHSTIRSQHAQLLQIHISNPIQSSSPTNELSELDEGLQLDNIKQPQNKRVWNIMNDNQLKARKSIPRIWSQQLYQSGLVLYDNGNNVVSKQFADGIAQRVGAITKITSIKGRHINTDAVYEQLCSNIEDLFNYMSIPVDRQVIEQFVNNGLPLSLVTDRAQRLAYLSAQIQQINVGSIMDIAKSIIRSAGKTVLNFNKINKSLDSALSGYSIDSQIALFAKAYNDVYPSPQEFSVTAPDGTIRYPISENNSISDFVRNLNHNTDDIINNLRKSPYTKHSLLLDAAERVDHNSTNRDLQIKLNCFVGIRDVNEHFGKDYTKITAIEDYLSKMQMTMQNMLVLPTMADKKTWYSISSPNIKLPHELVTYDNFDISGETLSIFKGYIRDEIESIKQYYSRDNVKYLIDNPGTLRINFHGKVKNGRLQFGGAGGKFRYFSQLIGLNDSENLNARLQHAFLKQQEIEQSPIEYGGLSQLRQHNKQNQELDGFELVRHEINTIEWQLFNDSDELNNMITMYIKHLVYNEFDSLYTNQTVKLGYFTEDWKLMPTKIPMQILKAYEQMFNKYGIKNHNVSVSNKSDIVDLALSAITNNVISQFISIEEVEKVFSGDPAFYKNKTISRNVRFYDGTYEIDFVSDKHSDKIKRLGALLSPGQKVRTDYSDSTIKKIPELKKSKYTVLNIKDINLKSEYLGQIRNMFAKQYLIDYYINNQDNVIITEFAKKHNYSNVVDLLNTLYTNDELYNELKRVIPIELVENFDNKAKSNTSPYGEINVSDAQVLIRPEMYRKIRISLGQWSFEDDKNGYSDEKAYNIIENDLNWESDAEKCKLVHKLQLFPLKMSYFQNSPIIQSSGENGNNYYNLPIYNKMAIFPAFKYVFQSTNGKALYDRMNRNGQEIDMIAFESAVKVGANQNMYKPYNDEITSLNEMNIQDLLEDSDITINKDNIVNYNKNGKLHVQVQDLDCLRMQLNTESHEDIERSLGTQALKLFLSNIIDDLEYRIGKDGETITGKQLRIEIMSLVNALTDKGVDSISKRFQFKDGKPNPNRIKDLISTIIRSNDLGMNAKEIIDNNGCLEALGSRLLFEQSVSKLINKKIVDINLNGGSAIQQSVFGFVGLNKPNILISTENQKVNTENGLHILNDGKKLRWITKSRSMEIMLSANFFKSIVPLQYQDSYSNMRQWLIDNDIIYGTKQTGEMSDPKPIGIGYRIPTQGMSSMFSFIVADILPSQSGDNIIVPEEFTAQTGSDFDVDKLFIAMKNYTPTMNEPINYNDDVKQAFQSGDFNVIHEAISSSYQTSDIRNALIQRYIDVLSDERTFVDARGSIDTVTDKIKHGIVPILKQAEQNSNTFSGYEMLPSFQAKTKNEFMAGKDGIGPFALNVTNLALTQTTHLTIDFGIDGDRYGLGSLDAMVGEDGLYISSWLSAMINAHVDVAKDPYISIMNVNPATYGLTNLLLRAGKGISTFSFLAQPVIKELADQINTHGGIYTDDATKDLSISKFRDTVLNNLLEKWRSIAASKIREVDADPSLSVDDKNRYMKLLRMSIYGFDAFEFASEPSIVFDYDFGIKSIQDDKSYEHVIMQCLSLYAYKDLTPYANELNELVRMSQVDTRKFGNNISAHYDFLNRYDIFKNNSHVYDTKVINWVINNEDVSKKITKNGDIEENSVRALQYYFSHTWLDQKLETATLFTKAMLNDQLFSATPEYEQLFKSVMYELFGDPYITNRTQTAHKNYQSPSDKKVVADIGTAISSIARNNMLSKDTYKIYQNNEPYSGPIDFNLGGSKEAVINKMLQMIYGNSNSEDSYERQSVFQSYAKLINNLKIHNIDDSLQDLIGQNGQISNEFLNYLIANMPNDKFPIGRFTTKILYINADQNYKAILQSALYQLLTHPNKKVRRLFRDIVFYDYYSSYNNGQMNSIFDLVPFQFKQQYVHAVTNALRSNNLGDSVTIDQDPLNAEEYIDSICRNYWTNNTIVPQFSLTNKSFGNIGDGEDLNLNWYILNKDRIPGAILTYKGGGHPYIKIVKKNDTYIYKRIGVVDKYSKGHLSNSARSVYVIVPKLGVHKNNIHQYEFISGNMDTSIYDNNLLPNTLSFDKLIPSITEYVDNAKVSQKEIKNGVYYKFRQIEPSSQGFGANYYYDVSNMDNGNKLNYNENGDVKFIYSTNKQKYINDITNFTISINTDNVKSNIHLDYSDNYDQFEHLINDALSGIDNDKIHLKLRFEGFVDNIVNSEQEVSDYVDSQMESFQNRISMNDQLSPKDVSDAILEFREQLLPKADEQLKQIKLNRFVDSIIKNILFNDYKIDSVYVTDTNNVGEAAVRAAQLNQENFDSDQAAVVILDKSMQNDDILPEIHKFDDDYTQFSDTENEDVKSAAETVNDGLQIMQEQNKPTDDVTSLLNGMVVDDISMPEDDSMENNTQENVVKQSSGVIQTELFDDFDFDSEEMNHCKHD